MLAIAVIDEHSLTRECLTKSLQTLCIHLDFTAFPSCEDCLGSPRPHRVILYCVHENIAKRGDKHCAAIRKLRDVAPVIVLCDVDCIDAIRMAFDCGARGYVPTTSTPLEVAIQIIHLVKAGGTFVPPCSLSSRRIDGQPATRETMNALQLTERQRAVLGCLQVGKPNKIIARDLAMSESTVKVHIRNLMRKLKASNRTEVACRAHELAISDAYATR